MPHPTATPQLVLAVLLAGSLGAATRTGDGGYPEVRTQPAGADGFLNLEYLPAWRYSGDRGVRRDYEMTLDLWVPEGRENCPLVMYVHGGAYSQGTKRLNDGYRVLGERLIAEGIAFGSLNYILKPREVRPQVWYDYRDAARYLRMHADRYRLDPTAFGAFGISAGGWLISNAGHGSGDVFSSEHNGSKGTIQELVDGGFVFTSKRQPNGIWAPLQNDRRGWPRNYGRWQAIAYDFSHLNDVADTWSPAMCDIIGAGQPAQIRELHDAKVAAARERWGEKGAAQTRNPFWARRDEGIIDHVYAEMLAPKFAGKGVHVPPLVGQPGESKKSKREHALTRHVVGDGEAELADVLARWFVDRLTGPNAKAPVPEIWPAMRLVDGPTEVSMVAPDGVSIRYTVDGTDPTPSSPAYGEPFTVEPGTVVKAIGVQDGKEPGGPMVATFVEGPVPPSLQDHERELPPARTGVAYRHAFVADGEGVHFHLKGDLVPYSHRKTEGVVLPNGMTLDPLTGVWSGTPTRPGRYWVQVAVNRGPGTVCRIYDFVWEVTGEDLGGGDAAPEAGADTNVIVLRLAVANGQMRKRLEREAPREKIDLVMQEDGGGLMLLVPERQKTFAKRFLIAFFSGELPAGARWGE